MDELNSMTAGTVCIAAISVRTITNEWTAITRSII